MSFSYTRLPSTARSSFAPDHNFSPVSCVLLAPRNLRPIFQFRRILPRLRNVFSPSSVRKSASVAHHVTVLPQYSPVCQLVSLPRSNTPRRGTVTNRADRQIRDSIRPSIDHCMLFPVPVCCDTIVSRPTPSSPCSLPVLCVGSASCFPPDFGHVTRFSLSIPHTGYCAGSPREFVAAQSTHLVGKSLPSECNISSPSHLGLRN